MEKLINKNTDPLPHISLLNPDRYTIVIANADQEEQHQISAFDEWGKDMCYEGFRSIAIREQAEGGWAKNFGDLTWALVKRDDPSGEVFSSCETQRMNALFKTCGGDMEDAWVYGVTVVNTPKHHRGKGYATHLCQLLHYALASPTTLPPFPSVWGTPPIIPESMKPYIPRAIASILWSDIGTDFYRRCTIGTNLPGWETDPENSYELVWKILQPSPQDQDQNPPKSPPTAHPSQQGDTGTIKWEYIYSDDIPQIADQLSKSARSRVNAIDKSSQSVFMINPQSEGTLTFLNVRGGYGPQPVWRNDIPNEPKGVRLRRSPVDENPPIDSETFVLLTISPQVTTRLLITYIHNLNPEHIPSLLNFLDHSTNWAIGSKEAVLWGFDPEHDMIRAWLQVEGRDVIYRPRKGESMLGIAWYGSETGDRIDQRHMGQQRSRGKMIDTQMWNWC